jgi:ribonuclease T2
MIPGVELIQKEWEKHGSCDFDNAKLYLAQTKALFSKLKLPSHDVLRQLHKKSYHAIKSAIVNLNTSIGLKEKHIWIVKKRGELREVHLCYNKDFTLKACR